MDGSTTRHKNLSRKLRAELDRLVAELADPEQREREIQAEAERRAEVLYRTRAFRAVSGSQTTQAEAIAPTPTTASPKRTSAPSGPRPRGLGAAGEEIPPGTRAGHRRITADEFKRRLRDR